MPGNANPQLGAREACVLSQPVEGEDEILVRVIPDRGELARRLLGGGLRFSPERDAVAELVAERAAEG